MSVSSVYFTPVCAGKRPEKKVERAGEHMHAFVVALVNVRPFFWSIVSPGRFFSDQPGGKCWIYRSWSVMKMIMFMSAGLPLGAGAVVALEPFASAPDAAPPR